MALAAGGLALYESTIPDRLEYDQAGASLEFELRAPAAFALPDDPAAIEVTLDTDLNQQPAEWRAPALREESARQVLAGMVELYYRTSSRLLVFRFPDSRDRIFRLRLAAKPDPEEGWSDWYAVDFVGLPGQPATVAPGPEDPLELRYRIQVWGRE